MHTVHCNSKLHTVHFKMQTAHCTLQIPNCTLFTANGKLHSVHCKLQTAHCSLQNANSTLYTANSKLHTVHCKMQTAYCTLQTPNCTLFTVEYNGYFKVTLRGKYIPLKVGEEKSKVTKKKGNIFTPEIIDQSMMEKAWVPPYPPPHMYRMPLHFICTGLCTRLCTGLCTCLCTGLCTGLCIIASKMYILLTTNTELNL